MRSLPYACAFLSLATSPLVAGGQYQPHWQYQNREWLGASVFTADEAGNSFGMYCKPTADETTDRSGYYLIVPTADVPCADATPAMPGDASMRVTMGKQLVEVPLVCRPSPELGGTVLWTPYVNSSNLQLLVDFESRFQAFKGASFSVSIGGSRFEFPNTNLALYHRFYEECLK